jgi:hypothetical protein
MGEKYNTIKLYQTKGVFFFDNRCSPEAANGITVEKTCYRLAKSIVSSLALDHLDQPAQLQQSTWGCLCITTDLHIICGSDFFWLELMFQVGDG